MKVIASELPGVSIIEPAVHGDERGFFFEAYHCERFAMHGLPTEFPQTNVSRSVKGVLRGLHHQWPKPQGKLVWVLEGSVFDVAVDIRRGSAHFGRWFGLELSAENHRMLYVPPGFAHGFCVTSEYATFAYMCTQTYDGKADRSIAWNDPRIGVDWPIQSPSLSPKDLAALPLSDIDLEHLPEL